jgi:hypothetical protein
MGNIFEYASLAVVVTGFDRIDVGGSAVMLGESDHPSWVLARRPSRVATVMAYVATALVCITACVGFALTILVFYPGYMTRDAAYVYGYVQSGYLGDWQSPLMTMLWRLIDPISLGSGSMFLLAATLYWLGFAIAALAVARRSGALAVAVLLLALAPPAFWFLAMIWRDVLFGAVWLSAAAIIYFAAGRSRDGLLDWKVRGWALALVGLGILLRPNAIVAAPLLIAYVAWPARFEWRRTALLFVPAVLAGYGLIHFVYYGILDVHRDNPLQSVVVFDLGGITYLTQENQFPVSWSADGYEEALLITQCYDPSHWDSYWTRDPCQFVMNRLQSEDDVVFGTPQLATAWLLAVDTHPLAYLRHRFNFLEAFLTGANATLELERMHLVDRVPLARNPYFLTMSPGMTCSNRRRRFGRERGLPLRPRSWRWRGAGARHPLAHSRSASPAPLSPICCPLACSGSRPISATPIGACSRALRASFPRSLRAATPSDPRGAHKTRSPDPRSGDLCSIPISSADATGQSRRRCVPARSRPGPARFPSSRQRRQPRRCSYAHSRRKPSCRPA